LRCAAPDKTGWQRRFAPLPAIVLRLPGTAPDNKRLELTKPNRFADFVGERLIGFAAQPPNVVGRVQSDRSAVSDHGPVPQSASSFDPPRGGSNKLAHPVLRPGFLRDG